MISRAAIHYLKQLRYPPVNIRCDVVEVIGSRASDAEPEIRHVPNAFTLNPRYRL